MSTEIFLSRLDRVKPTGPGRWLACCPAHEDKGPSLSIRELEDERTLVHCFAGCEVQAVVAAVGLSLEDLFPPRELGHAAKRDRRPFPAADILRAVAFEALVVATSGAALLAGQPFGEADRARLMLAVGRLQEAVRAGGLAHE